MLLGKGQVLGDLLDEKDDGILVQVLCSKDSEHSIYIFWRDSRAGAVRRGMNAVYDGGGRRVQSQEL